MDELDPFPGAYTLEVSSPGIDRPLRTLEHFARFEGEKARLCCENPMRDVQSGSACLAGVDADTVLLTVDGREERLPYDQIKKAHIIGRIDFSG